MRKGKPARRKRSSTRQLKGVQSSQRYNKKANDFALSKNVSFYTLFAHILRIILILVLFLLFFKIHMMEKNKIFMRPPVSYYFYKNNTDLPPPLSPQKIEILQNKQQESSAPAGEKIEKAMPVGYGSPETAPIETAAPTILKGSMGKILTLPQYEVQAAAFHSELDALQLSETLKKKFHLPVNVSHISVDGELWYRVMLGPFQSEEIANNTKQLLLGLHESLQPIIRKTMEI